VTDAARAAAVAALVEAREARAEAAAAQADSLALQAEMARMAAQATRLKDALAQERDRVKDLSRDNEALRKQVAELLRSPMISSDDLDDDRVRYYTGLPDRNTLKTLFASMQLDGVPIWYVGEEKPKATRLIGKPRGRPRRLSRLDELFMTLVFLRHSPGEQMLADLFKISLATCSSTVRTWIRLLRNHLCSLPWFLERAVIQELMPWSFRDSGFGDVRVIIDCTEFEAEKPSDANLQAATWSSYKHRNTFKSLLGISPNGCITFVSDLFTGSISDKDLTQRSGLLDKLEPGDGVMADRGFDIKELLLSKQARLRIPAFTSGSAQMPANDVTSSRRIASLRIHVERAIGRMKRYRILNFFPLTLQPMADDIVKVCAFLCNFWPPLLMGGNIVPETISDQEGVGERSAAAAGRREGDRSADSGDDSGESGDDNGESGDHGCSSAVTGAPHTVLD
jgi:hypothetical protein